MKQKIVFFTAAAICLLPFITPPIALALGLFIALFNGHPYEQKNQKATHLLLQLSVVGLGFGMNVSHALQAGKEGFLFTIFSICGILTAGFFLGKWLHIGRKTSYLISAGTAICGGSAIAALSPVIKAEEKEISVALGTVFILNSLALFLFPVIGHRLHLTETQFGLWSAIAIHDTSSVVGAAGRYGPHALEIATTVKLARALWIIPVTFLSMTVFKSQDAKVKMPYFIGWFVVAMLVNTYVPGMSSIDHYLPHIAKAGLTLTLFLIGTGLSAKVLRSVGYRPLVQGIILWGIISGASLWAMIVLI